MPHVFRIRRGLEEDIPILAPGEPAITTDTKKFFIGTVDGNICFESLSDVLEELFWNKILDTPTTLAGYGITDAEPKNSNIQSHISSNLNPHNVNYMQVGAAPASHATHISPIVAALVFGRAK